MTSTAEQAAPIPPSALVARLGERRPPVLVDVRSPAEFESAHVEGAVNVPLDLLREHGTEIAPLLGADSVLLCQSGPRAEEAQRLLARVGRAETRVLAGGMNAWVAAGEQVRRGKETWALERQVRFTAGSLVLAGIVGSLTAPNARFLAGAIGGGLVYSAATNTCAMGNVISRMPWNRGASAPGIDQVRDALGR